MDAVENPSSLNDWMDFFIYFSIKVLLKEKNPC